MEVLHVFVHVVFLAHLGAQGVPHLVAAIVAQCLGLFVRCEHFVNVATFLAVNRKIIVRVFSLQRMPREKVCEISMKLTLTSACFRHQQAFATD